jgi:hypothetical protein
MSSKLIILIALIVAAALFIIPNAPGKMAFVSFSFIMLPAWLGCLILLGIGYALAFFMGRK